MAMRFRFRLQTLLKLRRSMEEAAQRALASALRHRDMLVMRLEIQEKQRQEALEGRRAGPGEVLDLERWRQIERWLVVLERTIRQTKEALVQAENRVAEARAALLRAHMEHMTLLRLRERRKEQFDLEALRQEAKEADEIAVLRHRLNHPPSAEKATKAVS